MIATSVVETYALPAELQQNIRDAILRFEALLSELPGAGFGDIFPLKHSFAEGCYVREILVPKGYVCVGKIHKHSHPRFILSGEFIAFTEHTGWQYFKAPAYAISQAGRKSIFIALEDSIIVTVHVTNETDLSKIEEDVVAKGYDALKLYEDQKQSKQLMQKDTV